MSSRQSMDFNCPQYVDFCRLMEEDNTEKSNEVFSGINSPPNVPEAAQMALCSSSVRKCSTPLTNAYAGNETDSDKQLRARQFANRLSKSFETLVAATAENHDASAARAENYDSSAAFVPLRERSRSENDVRPRRRNETRPKKRTDLKAITPDCLKRPKKERAKTSEQLELEKIAQMQEQMRQRLRESRASLRRLNLTSSRVAVVPQRLPPLREESERRPPRRDQRNLAEASGLSRKVDTCRKAIRDQLLPKRGAAAACFTPGVRIHQSVSSPVPGPSHRFNVDSHRNPGTIKKFPSAHSGVYFPKNHLDKKTVPTPFSSLAANAGENESGIKEPLTPVFSTTSNRENFKCPPHRLAVLENAKLCAKPSKPVPSKLVLSSTANKENIKVAQTLHSVLENAKRCVKEPEDSN